MEYEVIWMPQAERQLEHAVLWWRANRVGNPDLLLTASSAAGETLRTMPSRTLGVPPSRHPARRRLLVPRTPYVIIYRVRPRARRVEIVAFKYAARR